MLVAIAWALDSVAQSPAVLYAAAAISGVGAGAVYGTCVGNALKWWADRRGRPASERVRRSRSCPFARSLPLMAMRPRPDPGRGGPVVVALAARAPRPGQAPPAPSRLNVTARDYTFIEMLQTPVFYGLYVMFVLVSASGLMATAEVASIAKDYGISNTIVFLGWTMLTVALVVDKVLNGLARPFFGWVSDIIGRENTVAIAFTLGGAAYRLPGTIGTQPIAFIAAAGLVYSPRARSSASFRRPAPTPTVAAMQPAMPAGSIRRKAPRSGWCRSPRCSRTPAAGMRSSSSRR